MSNSFLHGWNLFVVRFHLTKQYFILVINLCGLLHRIHVSMDHSKDSSSSDEKDFRSSNAATAGGIFGQATVEDAVPTDYTNTTSVNGDGLANRPDSTVLPTDPDAPAPLDNGDSIIIIDQEN